MAEIIGAFDNLEEAQAAAKRPVATGVAQNQISIIGHGGRPLRWRSKLKKSLLWGGALGEATHAQTPKPVKAAKTTPKSDSEIQSCIEQKLAAAPKLKDQGFSVTVSSGVATFTGAAKNEGSKGSAGGVAKSCGAKKVVNNISVEKMAKTKH